MANYYRFGPVWGGFIAAIVGLAFCVFMLLGVSDALCITEGCSLLNSMTIGGISLWWFGALGFLGLGVLSMLPYPGLALFGVCLVLSIDCVLLLIMLFAAPCFPCLIAALLFAVLFIIVRTAVYNYRAVFTRSVLLIVWLVLFFANLLPLGLQYLGVWSIAGQADSPVRVYFSPSCPTCREALIEAESMPAGVIAYIPVTEGATDLPVIIRMNRELQADPSQTVTAALNTAQAQSQRDGWSGIAWTEIFSASWRTLRNRAQAINAGATRIPFFTMNGKPQGGILPSGGAGIGVLDILPVEPGASGSGAGGGIPVIHPAFGPDSFQGCGQGASQEPCD